MFPGAATTDKGEIICFIGMSYFCFENEDTGEPGPKFWVNGIISSFNVDLNLLLAEIICT